MRESDLPPASRILRLAFGTFIGAPDPENFRADREYLTTRFQANPDAALVAEAEGTVTGSNFAARWGSCAFFGPLTVSRRALEPGHRSGRSHRPHVYVVDNWR